MPRTDSDADDGSFLTDLHRELPQLMAIMMLWAAPAVIIGGQVGPRVAQGLLSEGHPRLYFSAVLIELLSNVVDRRS